MLAVASDKGHLAAVKEAYKQLYPGKGGLMARITGDTSGDQQKFLLALVTADDKHS